MATQNDTKSQDKTDKVSTKLTKADAAKMVKRTVPVLDDKNQPVIDEKTKKPKTKQVDVAADEVLNFAEYADRVVVVTTSGEKLSAAK